MAMIEITHNGFHGRNLLRFRGEANPDGIVNVSARVAARLNRQVCPGVDCKCGEAAAKYYGHFGGSHDTWIVCIPANAAEMRGHYPQQ